ncbi:MAG: asparagine synthase-related protein [Pseudomonadota bacterium]
MQLIATGDPFSVSPYYYTSDNTGHGNTISSVVTARGCEQLDVLGIKQYLHKSPDDIRTCFQKIKKLPPNCDLLLEHGKLIVRSQQAIKTVNKNLFELLVQALRRDTACYTRCALALSGGIDSALILALIKEAAIENIEIYTLATGMQGYCELEITKRTAQYYGVKLNIAKASQVDFVNALPAAIRSCEAPLYNLHPVSKLLLARAMKSDGVDCVISGDAADQVFSGSAANNYLPIVGSIMRGEGIGFVSPFFDKQVVAFGLSVMDSDKSALRKLGLSLLPEFLQQQKKQPRLAPVMDAGKYWNQKCIDRIAQQINLQPDLANDSLTMLWTTLGMLVQTICEKQTCVE